MIAYLLDTNILSDLVDHPFGMVALRLAVMDDSAFATSIIVAGELRFGSARKMSPQLTTRIESALARISVLPLEGDIDVRYGMLRADLQRQGRVIGNNDMWIAAHALSLGATLITDNTREFERVDGLAIENWLRD